MSENGLTEAAVPTAGADVVYCCDVHGQLHPVPRTQITFNPAVYGILVEDGQVLLHKNRTTQWYQPPGGRVAPEQTATQAMRQHFRATTGITPIIGDLLLVEDVYELDEERKAWHISRMYYALERPVGGREGLIDFENSARPDWVDLAKLKREHLQLGYDAVIAAVRRMRS